MSFQENIQQIKNPKKKCKIMRICPILLRGVSDGTVTIFYTGRASELGAFLKKGLEESTLHNFLNTLINLL